MCSLVGMGLPADSTAKSSVPALLLSSCYELNNVKKTRSRSIKNNSIKYKNEVPMNDDKESKNNQEKNGLKTELNNMRRMNERINKNVKNNTHEKKEEWRRSSSSSSSREGGNNDIKNNNKGDDLRCGLA